MPDILGSSLNNSKNSSLAVCLVSPNMNGGIKRLFDGTFSQPIESSIKLDWFVSNDETFSNILRFPFRLAKLLHYAMMGRYGLYHFNLASNGSTLRKILYSLALQAFGQSYVVHLHGAGFREFYNGVPRAARVQIRRFFHRADRVVVLGQVWRDFVIETLDIPSERVVILPNAVKGPRCEIDHSPEEIPHILFLGRLGARKGVPELLDALASPELKALSWTATIAGDGDVETYRTRGSELGLSERISFPGWVDSDQVTTLLEQANILVLPSHAENLPLSMLEGMAYGLCPIVTPVGAVEDVIRDGENGILVAVGSATNLASALIRVCKDGATRQAIAQMARADFLANYDIADYRGRLEAIYMETIAARNGH
jgi:glycosyltransferase involved in cell wall biosynthesis